MTEPSPQKAQTQSPEEPLDREPVKVYDQVFLGLDGIITASQVEDYVSEKIRRARERAQKIAQLRFEIQELEIQIEELEKDAETPENR